jgi:hypothetical protein
MATMGGSSDQPCLAPRDGRALFLYGVRPWYSLPPPLGRDLLQLGPIVARRRHGLLLLRTDVVRRRGGMLLLHLDVAPSVLDGSPCHDTLFV